MHPNIQYNYNLINKPIHKCVKLVNQFQKLFNLIYPSEEIKFELKLNLFKLNYFL